MSFWVTGQFVIFILIALPLGLCYVPVQPNMKSFSSAIKNGILVNNEEKILYERTSGPGVITEQWFTGKGVMDEDARIRIYIDGETNASLDFMLFLAHGIGVGENNEVKNLPWGSRLMSHIADGGGLFNTFRIPFLKSFKVTVTRNHSSSEYLWYIIRGVENYPIVLGDLLLPSNAKLRLYKNEHILLKPLEFLTLAKVNSAGALFMVTMVTNSSTYAYLEACMRAVVDGEKMFLSSGTEDFFLSAYYFNTGIYHTNDAGLTAIDGQGLVSMYKFFERDPILFSKSFELMWRCGETIDDENGCPSAFRPKWEDDFIPTLSDTVVTTYTWVYEW
jgi:hypothetical protein